MRAVIQRVANAKVTVNGEITGEIGKGILVFFGMLPEDDDKVIDYMLDKVISLRIFEDENDKMNLSLKDIKGELLIVPNFTLYGDARKGKRPSYSTAATPVQAESIFNRLLEKAALLPVPKVAAGKFQEHMEVVLLNDGPVTILLDSKREF